jgi:ubiquinone/menaquinone biosynthesis C-methylase UbiE
MDKKTADKIIKQNKENYDSFAESFSQTRNYLPEAAKSLFEDHVRAGDRVLDNGCGNGRFYPFFKEKGADYVGIDNSEKLVDIAKKKYPEAEFKIDDALELSFASEEFGLVISMAVLHHIPSKAYRRQFFQEAWRVLKPGGRLIVTVWNLRPLALARARQWKRFKSFIKVQIKIAMSLEKLDFGDFYIPWQNEYQRYVHSFTLGGMKKLAVGAGFQVLESGVMRSGKKESNLYITVQKV